jgi:hypothetical protein
VQGLRDLDTENDTVAAAIAEAQAEVELARPYVSFLFHTSRRR